MSGEIRSLKIDIGDYEKFKKVKLSNVDVSEVISVVDTDGHEYYQVDYLSQDVVYRDVTNRGTDSDTVPSVLRPFVVPREICCRKIKKTQHFYSLGTAPAMNLQTHQFQVPQN